jgi:hypothetical protein
VVGEFTLELRHGWSNLQEALNIEASALFLLRVMDPRAARAVLFTAASAMEDAIRAENAETEYLQ